MSPLRIPSERGAWYAPYADDLDTLARGGSVVLDNQDPARVLDRLNELSGQRQLKTRAGHALRFIDADRLTDGSRYEALVACGGRVATRLGPRWHHDLFNALVWLRFPAVKAQLNTLQANVRNDPATLFDESAAVLVVPAQTAASCAMIAALRAGDWADAFVARRAAWQRTELLILGHGLLEKLRTPYKSMTAHTWVLPAPPGYFDTDRAARHAWADQRVADKLPHWLSDPGTRMPLPLAGVPGWFPGNDDPAFYNDETVFRRRVIRVA